MYVRTERQIDFFQDPTQFVGVKLNPHNRWVERANLFSWVDIEEEYRKSFANPHLGARARPARFAFGCLLIKELYGWTDGETIRQIRENPYMQFFLGLPAFEPFLALAPSTMSDFRKRFAEDRFQTEAAELLELEKEKSEGSLEENQPE